MTNIIGHEDVLNYLSRGIAQKRLCPSLLFVGPEGVGKKTVALHAAELLHCDPVSDFLLISAENQNTIKIENVRQIDRFLSLKATEQSPRVCVIEDADKLTEEAANALLKILEEPPPQTLIVLLAVSERNILPTILSRCAVLRFRPLPTAKIAVWLEKNRGVSQNEAELAAARCDGRMSRAIKLLEESPEVTLEGVELDEFFASLAEPSWRKEGRARATEVVTRLTEEAQSRLEKGDMTQTNSLQALFQARRQLDRFTPPKLVLENLFIKLRPVFK